MRLKKTLLIAALVAGNLIAWDMVLHAQESTNTPPATPAPGARPRPGANRLMEQLNLTDDQKPKVQAIMNDMRQQIQDVRADTSLSQDDRRAKMQAIRTDTEAKLKAVLTPGQFDQWQKMTQHRRPTPPPAATGTNAPPQQ